MAKANWSKENLSKIVSESYSQAEVIKALGLKPAGGSYSQLRKYISKYNLDTSHFTGSLWHSNPKLSNEDKKLNSLEDILQENTNYSSDRLKKRLIDIGYKLAKCECCGNSEWNGKEIPLELHHIDGNHYNNKLENLQILCCNCHAQTDNYRTRNKNANKEDIPRISSHKTLKMKECEYCGKSFQPGKRTQKYCSVTCAKQAQKKA